MEQVWILGCGLVGLRVASLYTDHALIGVVRSEDSAERIRAAGHRALRADLDALGAADADWIRELAGQKLFYFAPPPSQGRVDRRIRGLLDRLDADASPRRIVYISTTGVYGDCGGAWITEDQPLAPAADRAHRRLDAESALGDWARRSGGERVILRVAGIYGPGRLPAERLRKQLPVIRREDSPFTNRIHLFDLARVAQAAMESASDGSLYNVSDGHPGTMVDYFNRVADHLGLPHPPAIRLDQAEGTLSAGMLSYMEESRRLCNSRMLSELDLELEFPTLERGLTVC